MIPMNKVSDDSGYPKRAVFQYFSDQLRHRWYVIEHGVDLLDAWYIKRHWGGLGRQQGGSMTRTFQSEQEMAAELRHAVAHRCSRGYAEH